MSDRGGGRLRGLQRGVERVQRVGARQRGHEARRHGRARAPALVRAQRHGVPPQLVAHRPLCDTRRALLVLSETGARSSVFAERELGGRSDVHRLRALEQVARAISF